jgi:hypothetical protein
MLYNVFEHDCMAQPDRLDPMSNSVDDLILGARDAVAHP